MFDNTLSTLPVLRVNFHFSTARLVSDLLVNQSRKCGLFALSVNCCVLCWPVLFNRAINDAGCLVWCSIIGDVLWLRRSVTITTCSKCSGEIVQWWTELDQVTYGAPLSSCRHTFMSHVLHVMRLPRDISCMHCHATNDVL